MNFDKELDVRGQNCPIPIMKAKKAMTELSTGKVLKVMGTDPNSQNEFRLWAKQGVELISVTEQNGVFTYMLRKL